MTRLFFLIPFIGIVTLIACFLSFSDNALSSKTDLVSYTTLFLAFPHDLFEIDNSFSLIPKAFGITVNDAIGLSSVLSSNDAIGLSSVLSSKTAVVTTAPGPTYNPPLKECPTGDPKATTTLGGFDIAKYVITGKLNKDKIKGDKFAFNIFSDLVKNDGAEIKGKDAPFKANYATEDGDKIADIDLDEIATVCIDTAKIVNVDEKTDIDLEDSTLFESLEYDD